ncbi:MAG TPA: CxxxxCH/CxxCH domain-containing protein [Kofleriaceae bacterium]|nr:CxxxxCH/CxxCH domain-containing protein [Kofleriaceae bacterium]
MRIAISIGILGMILGVVGASALVGCVGGIDDPAAGADVSPPNADPQAGCAIACHGDDLSNAPPRSISGATDTTSVAVGAHQAHLIASPSWHKPVECADCHVVPKAVGDPGHIDGDNKAELTFSMRAGGTASTWNGTTCSVACHGQAAWGGTNPTPTWTRVDGTQSACGSCHGAPPPPPHPAGSNCAACHPTMEENSLNFRDPASHINGVVDVVTTAATGGCTSCHGSATNAAPPRDLAGNTATTAPTVGAHQAHLAANNQYHAVVCTSCHTVPQTVDAPGHMDGDNVAEVKFDALNPQGTYTKATATCSTMYCHGNGRGGNGTIAFTQAGPLACNACHATNGTGMSGRHSLHLGEGIRCNGCHRDVVDQNMTIIKGDLHVNGVHEVKMANGTWNATARSCSNTGCHGTKSW